MPKQTKVAKPEVQTASSPAVPDATVNPSSIVIPHLGYATAKRNLVPIRLMLSELGRQDASIQLQELSLLFLESTAHSMGVRINDFLKILYQAKKIPHGSHVFNQLRQVFINSQITLTYAHLERMLKDVIKMLRKKRRVPDALPDMDDGWSTQRGRENLAPLQQLEQNLSAVETVSA